MNAIDNYNQIKHEVQKFEQWAGLLNKEYFGGTRGKGNQYGEIIEANGSLTIYFQEYDGATNHHKLDENYSSLLSEAMKAKGHILIQEMRENLNRKLAAAKADAQKLAAELMA